MRAGRLTSTIVVDRKAEITEADGTAYDTWARVLTTRAEVISSDARTFLAEPGQTVERGIVFRIRFRDGIEPGDRVMCDGLAYDLAEIKVVVARRVLELRCTGGVS